MYSIGGDMGVVKLSVLILLEVTGQCLSADLQSMRTNIQTHFSQSRHHATNNQYKIQARNFIHAEFQRLGLETEYQEFEDTINYPSVKFNNVIGVLKGERFGTSADKILGLGAHYDTMPDSPGVDDNGAGVAAMLEVIRQLTEASKQGTKRKNTIIFVSFDAEELGYLGGYALTNSWLQPYLDKNYGQGTSSQGVIIMDTMMNFDTTKQSQKIPPEYQQEFQQHFPEASANMASDGYEGDFLLLTYRQPAADNDLATAFKTAWNSAGSPNFEIESFPLPIADPDQLDLVPALSNFMRSDHVAFWRAGIPAIFISDSANFRGDMQNCYHKQCDNVQTMLQDDNIQFLGKTADAVTSTLHTLSEASGPGGGSNGGSTSGVPGRQGSNIAILVLLFLAILPG